MLLLSSNDNPNLINNSYIGWQIHFGVWTNGTVSIVEYCRSNLECPFKKYGKECFCSTKEDINTCIKNDEYDMHLSNHDNYLERYRYNSQRRINRNYRKTRESLNIKLDTIDIDSILLGHDEISKNKTSIEVMITIQAIGVCTISAWLVGYVPQNETQWKLIREPENIVVKFSENSEYTRVRWPLMELFRFLALNCHRSINPMFFDKVDKTDIENHKCLKNNILFKEYIEDIYCRDDIIFSVPVDLECYPIAYLRYSYSTEEFKNKFIKDAGDLRLFLYGDVHWRYKTSEVIDVTVKEIDISSRNSIKWLVTSQGTIKLSSVDLETSIEESFTAMLLETDIILTMKYFLILVMHKLGILSNSKSETKSVIELKESLFLTMDNYFNINMSHNDQTIKRIEKLKKIFHLDDTYKNVMDRFEILSVKIANENSSKIEKQQIWLTTIFGMFGALQVINPFFLALLEKTKLPSYIIILISLSITFTLSTFIYILIKVLNHKKNKVRR